MELNADASREKPACFNLNLEKMYDDFVDVGENGSLLRELKWVLVDALDELLERKCFIDSCRRPFRRGSGGRQWAT